MDREELLAILADAIRALDRSIDAAPPASTEAEELRLKRMRTLRALASEYRKLEREHGLDELSDEIELLKDDAMVDQ